MKGPEGQRRVRTLPASLPYRAQPVKLADPPLTMEAPPPCMQKNAISHVTFHRGAGRRPQRVQMRAPTACVSKQRKCVRTQWGDGRRVLKFNFEHPPLPAYRTVQVSEFNGALKKRLQKFKIRARTLLAELPNMLHVSKLADPPTVTPPPCMQKYAIGRVTFQRDDGRRLQKV